MLLKRVSSYSCVAALVMSCASYAAQDSQSKLHLAALIEEARLLLEEFQALDPVTQAVREEDERLRKQERDLSRASAQLGQSIEAHNRAAAALSQRVREHQQRCPRTMSDDAAIEACNERGAQLVAEGRELDRRHVELGAEQQELHRQIALFNSSQQSWVKVRREHLPKLAANDADANQWVARAQAFTTTQDFAALVNAAGDPAACEDLRGWSPPPKPGIPGLKKLYACLAAIAPGG